MQRVTHSCKLAWSSTVVYCTSPVTADVTAMGDSSAGAGANKSPERPEVRAAAGGAVPLLIKLLKPMRS